MALRQRHLRAALEQLLRLGPDVYDQGVINGASGVAWAGVEGPLRAVLRDLARGAAALQRPAEAARFKGMYRRALTDRSGAHGALLEALRGELEGDDSG